MRTESQRWVRCHYLQLEEMKNNELVVIHNKDKTWHEKWTDGRNWCNFPHPFRCLLIGTPGCGKTSAAQNILINQNPPFEELIIVHVDKDYSEEWDNCEPTEITSEIPDFRKIDGKVKKLIVFEDIEFSHMNPKQLGALSRLWGYCSTHKNTSIISCQQDPSAIPSIMRRLSSIFVLWKALDMKILDLYASKFGIPKGAIQKLMAKYCKNNWDGIWLDNTSGSPAPIRLNCFIPISLEDVSENVIKY